MSGIDEEGYFLAIRALGRHPMLKIDQARFDEIKVASTNLRRVLDIEEQWAAVIQNYFDLEMGLLGAATKHLIMPDTDWNSMNDSRLIFSVRLANLLSSCRSYLDQTAKNLGCIEPNLGDANTFIDFDCYATKIFINGMIIIKSTGILSNAIQSATQC